MTLGVCRQLIVADVRARLFPMMKTYWPKDQHGETNRRIRDLNERWWERRSLKVKTGGTVYLFGIST